MRVKKKHVDCRQSHCLKICSLDLGRFLADVGLDNIAVLELPVSVGRPDNELLRLVHHGESRETLRILAAPSRSDSEWAALGGAAAGPGSLGVALGLDNHGARGRLARLGVDGKVPGASFVATVAGALHVLNSPFDTVRPLGNLSGRGSGGCSGREESGKEGLGDLHIEGSFDFWTVLMKLRLCLW